MAKPLNTEQYAVLSHLESYLQTAVYNNYIRSLPMADARQLAAIHVDIFGHNPNLRCPKCVLEMCKNLGNAYYNLKKEL